MTEEAITAQGRNFHHPFKPYEIQLQFMNALYDCIEQGKVGIFESPTGTGKSLSLICGSLTWLREHKRRLLQQELEGDNDDDEPDWMVEHARKEQRQAALTRREELEARLERIRQKERKIRQRYENGEPRAKKQRTVGNAQRDSSDDESEFVPNAYESDEETTQKPDTGLSSETQALLKKLGFSADRSTNEDDQDIIDETKIFLSSRTHSQLSQFVGELRKVMLPAAIQPEPQDDPARECKADQELAEELKHLTLGSRKNLCINSKVNKLGSTTAINERCLELQQSGTPSDRKCSYLPTKDTEALVNDFRDHAIAKVRDIEDLGELGKRLGICPYYASRPAISPSEIVTLPYPLLLQKSAREALDLSLKNHVVIIDEAHNLMDAIAGIYSISITLAQLQRSRDQLGTYLRKFNNRLKGKNRVYVAQTTRLIDSLMLYLQKALLLKDAEGIVEPSDLMVGKGVDQINLYKLTRYLKESKLARKVDGYAVLAAQKSQQEGTQANDGGLPDKTIKNPGSMPTLTHIQNFLVTLMNPSVEGRFFYARSDLGDVALKYMLLDPSHHFREIVDEARAVILAGGTMSPIDDYISHLLPELSPSKLMSLSCGHVIPPSNLLALPVLSGPSGKAFNFTFEHRNTEATIIALGQAILDLIHVIPDGVVAFFPSYAYLDRCIAAWKKAPVGQPQPKSSYWDALQQAKPVFFESRSQPEGPKSNAAGRAHAPASTPTTTANGSTRTPPIVESTLAAYASAVANPPTGNPHRGALLLAVIGGSLSEGINFSDALGRGLLVVGLPFPNPHSAEWKAKAEYIAAKADKAAAAARASVAGDGGVMDVVTKRPDGKTAVREHYENVCMRAVNQCVGRAIRHAGDYAAIVLLDERYAGQRIRGKLPGWVRGSLREGMRWNDACREVQSFFTRKS